MAIADFPLSQQEQARINMMHDLCNTLEYSEHIENVYFRADGEYFFRAFDYKGNKYSQLELQPVKKTLPNGEVMTRNEGVGVPKYLIVKELSKEEALKLRPKEPYGDILQSQSQNGL